MAFSASSQPAVSTAGAALSRKQVKVVLDVGRTVCDWASTVCCCLWKLKGHCGGAGRDPRASQWTPLTPTGQGATLQLFAALGVCVCVCACLTGQISTAETGRTVEAQRQREEIEEDVCLCLVYVWCVCVSYVHTTFLSPC